jgi:ABC-type sugar transport system ATPase subunit
MIASLATRVLILKKGRITAELAPTALNDQALVAEHMGL